MWFFFQTESFFFGIECQKMTTICYFELLDHKKTLRMKKVTSIWCRYLIVSSKGEKKHENQRCKRLNTPKIFPQKTWYFGVYSGKKIRLCDKNSLRYLKKLLCLFFVISRYSNTLNYKIFMWLKFQFFFSKKSMVDGSVHFGEEIVFKVILNG